MVVETAAGVWVVPPHRAVWLPAETDHKVTMRGMVAMRTVYFDDRTRLPLKATCVVEVTPLLRELLIHVAKMGPLDFAVALHAARWAPRRSARGRRDDAARAPDATRSARASRDRKSVV